MQLSCPFCGFATDVPEEHLPTSGAKVNCGQCSAASTFDGQALRSDTLAQAPTGTAASAPAGADAGTEPPQQALRPGWYIHVGGEQQGPMDVQAVQALITARNLKAQDHVLAPQDEGWSAASTRRELAPFFAQASGGLSRAAARAAGAAAAAVWHVRTAAGEQGPIDFNTVKTMIRSGELASTDVVFEPGATEWVSADGADELVRFFNIKSKQAHPAKPKGQDGTPVDPFSVCQNHPGKPAEYSCQQCSLYLCADCTPERPVQRQTMRFCPKCNDVAMPFTPRKVIVPFWKELREVTTFPLRNKAWIALLVISFLDALTIITPFWYVEVFLSSCIFAYLLLITRTASKGRYVLPDLSKIEHHMRDLVYPGLKGMLVSVLVMLPAIWYSISVVGPATADWSVGLWQEERQEKQQAWEDEPSNSFDDEEAGEDYGEDEFAEEEGWTEEQLAMVEIMRTNLTPEEFDEWLGEFEAQGEGQEAAGFYFGEALEEEEPTSHTSGFGLFLIALGIPALLLYALLLWPMLLIIVALFNQLAPALNPAVVLRLIREVWPCYSKLLLFIVALFVPLFVLSLLAGPEPALFQKNYVASLARNLLLTPVYYYLMFVMFHAMGRTAEEIDDQVDL